MIRLSTFAAVIAATSTAIGSPIAAGADEPLQIRSFLDDTRVQQGLSALCGFTVVRHIEGPVHVTLFLDDDGNPVHEIGNLPSMRTTYFSPETGKSVSYPSTGTSITDYYPDHTALVSLDGFLTFVHASGDGPLLLSVGRIVYTAEVIGMNEDGVPITGDPIQVLFATGVEDGSILDACQALAP